MNAVELFHSIMSFTKIVSCIFHKRAKNWCIELHISVFVSLFAYLSNTIIYSCTYMNMSQFVLRSDPKHWFFHTFILEHANKTTKNDKIRLPSPKQIIRVKTLPPKNGKTGYYREFMKTTFRALTWKYSSRNIFRFGKKSDLCAINLQNVFIHK